LTNTYPIPVLANWVHYTATLAFNTTAYATAGAASLPSTATNHVTLKIYWKLPSVVSFAQRYGI